MIHTSPLEFRDRGVHEQPEIHRNKERINEVVQISFCEIKKENSKVRFRKRERENGCREVQDVAFTSRPNQREIEDRSALY